MATKAIILSNFNLGGLADSKYMGLSNSLAAIVGFDLHSTPGVIKANQKLTKESGILVDDFVKAIVPCSDGSTYLFGSTAGKIWKRDSGGTYTLEATAAPSSGGVGILDAIEYDGYIYYAMEEKLGRWQIGTAWTARVDNWATFSNGDTEFHPMAEQNLVLYIGDGNYVAQVDGSTFSANALDIKDPLRIKALGKIDTDILIGTYVNNNVNKTEVLRWNTWSVSYSVSDPIEEVGINAFIPGDNFVLVNAGINGNIYVYNGVKLEVVKSIPGDYSPSKYGYLYPNASANFKGLPLLGFSNGAGDPALQGVYSFGSKNPSYPKVLNFEYPVSQNVFTKIEIGAIAILGNDILVSWKDTNGAAAYGVDKVDYTAKYSGAYLETRIINLERFRFNKYTRFIVNYEDLPAGTSIALSYKKTHETSWTAFAVVTDTDRKQVYSDLVLAACTMQLKLEVTVSGNDSPIIEDITLLID